MDEQTKNKLKTLGGQAVIEGVMVRCGNKTAMSVRRKDGSIHTETRTDHPIGERIRFLRWPIIRGSVNLVEQMRIGYAMLMRSAHFFELDAAEEEEPKKKKKAPRDGKQAPEEVRGAEAAHAQESTAADSQQNAEPSSDGWVVGLALVFAIALMIGLFFMLPTLFAGWILPGAGAGTAALESVLRIVIFVGYIALIGLMKDMRRIFMYHGAEHKALFCYQHQEEPTPAHTKKYSRIHPQCGTTYLFLVMMVSILVFSVIQVGDNILLRIAVRVAMVPLVAGIAYELLKWFAKHDNIVAKIVRAPGMALQYFTTREPADDMLEVAYSAIRHAAEDFETGRQAAEDDAQNV